MPLWLAWADVDDAGTHMLIDPMTITDDDVMDTSTAWQGCWTRITQDADRRPITFAEAMMPVVWDTTGLPVGDYVIEGYTYEPAFNLWTERKSNVVRVFDGGDAATDNGPAVAIISDESVDPPYMGQHFAVAGCADAMDGSTLSAFYASTEGADSGTWNPDWAPFVSDMPLDLDSEMMFNLDFVPPDEVAGQSVAIKVEVTDPMDRTYTAYRYDLVFVVAGTDPNDCETGGSFIGNPGCAGSSSGTGGSATGGGTDGSATGGSVTAGNTTSGGTTSGGGSSTGPKEDGGGGSKHGCSIGGDPAGGLLGLGVVALLGLRRRRRG